jgi:hypothetical protein
MKVKIGEIKNLIEGNIYSKDINNEHIIFFKLGNKVYALEDIVHMKSRFSL